MKLKTFIKAFFYTGIILVSFFAASHTQQIIDWWRLRDYVPPASIVALADNSSMSDKGRRIFYVYYPELLEKGEFTEKCTVGEVTIVLGCYISNNKIYVFNVVDERLEGVEEVTAAHEMLHAVYDRLLPRKQDEINEALLNVYNKLDNPRLTRTIDSYRDRDGSVINDELHSIIGTEVRDLPTVLEEHYAQYFNDRLTVVALAEKYVLEFEKREQQIKAYDEQLAKLQSEIATLEATISLKSSALMQERIFVENLNGSASEVNQAIRAYNNKVADFNNDVNSLKKLVTNYNEIVSKRNEIALEERELVEAIDTRVEEL